MTTKFEEKIDEAKQKVTEAYAAVLVCLQEDTEGYNDISSDYIDDLHKIAPQLLEIKRKL